jgi:hypothetical protein
MADVTQTAANVVSGTGAKIETYISGGVVAGNSCYVDTADSNKLKPAQGTSATTAGGRIIALATAADDQPVQAQVGGKLDVGGTLVVATLYGTSAAVAGNIAPVADLISTNIVKVLGIADATNSLDMDFNSNPVVP